MASLKEMRNRISSVKATQKITKAMQMVAAAKLRRSQDAAEAARPYARRLASVIANLCYPLEGIQGYYNTLSNYELQLGLERCSPYYLYSEAATTLLNPDVRFIGFTTTDALAGALSGTLSFGQSALLVWPHLVCMVALALLAFAVSYIVFMRQEVRA